MPWGIALDGAGNVYVADWRNDRVQKFDPSGKFMDQWGASGDGDGQFHRPAGLSVDGEGNIYVADWGNERVQVMTQRGDVLASFRGDSVDSNWSKDYFLANPEEAAARRRADLEPEVDPPVERHREQSANVEKLLWGTHGGQGGRTRADFYSRQLPPPAAGLSKKLTPALLGPSPRIPQRHGPVENQPPGGGVHGVHAEISLP